MSDNVNHPAHYADGFSNGAEVIDITENLNFNRGNCVKYVARAGRKNPATEIEDLLKAQWYLEREIERLGSMLVQREGYIWTDKDDTLWRWQDNCWQYFDDAGDRDWVPAQGWPSSKYKPFTLITTTEGRAFA